MIWVLFEPAGLKDWIGIGLWVAGPILFACNMFDTSPRPSIYLSKLIFLAYAQPHKFDNVLKIKPDDFIL